MGYSKRHGILRVKSFRNRAPTLRYEPGVILGEKDYVTVHGRFSGTRSGFADFPVVLSLHGSGSTEVEL
jgi:hypothetical protein